jgi:hypothetical protein
MMISMDTHIARIFQIYFSKIMNETDRRNYLPALHFSEQYLTFSQSRAHFLRHSKGRLHVAQILGGKPFFVFAVTLEE